MHELALARAWIYTDCMAWVALGGWWCFIYRGIDQDLYIITYSNFTILTRICWSTARPFTLGITRRGTL